MTGEPQGRFYAGHPLVLWDGIAVSIPLGVAMSVSPIASAVLTPLVRFFSVLARIAWIPIPTLCFGYGFGAITFVIFNAVFFVVTYNTLLGIASIARPLRHAAASLGAGPWRVLIEVLLPGALPNIVTGVRNGLGYGWRAVIAPEMIVGANGIGFLMFDARRAGSVTEILLGMIVLGLLWYVVDGWLLVPLERATVQRWGLVAP